MAILKDLAQVLRVYEQGNTSLIAVMLGRRLGQFRVYAKGSRRWPKKGFEGGLDLLARGEILLYPRSGEGLWVFKEWEEQSRPRVGQSLAMLRAASYLCELTEALTRQTASAITELNSASRTDLNRGFGGLSGQPGLNSNMRLFDQLAATADVLANGGQAGPVLLNFTLRLLGIEGMLPGFDNCTACDKSLLKPPQTVWLTTEGLFCKQCATQAKQEQGPRGMWLSPEAHRVLVHLFATPRPVRASINAASQVSRAMVLLVHGALEHDLRTLAAAAQRVGEMAGMAGKS